MSKSDLLKPLKWYTSLATKKGRREAGAFLVEGERAVNQVMLTHPGTVIELLASEWISERDMKIPVRVLEAKQIRTVSSMKTPQDRIAVVRIPKDLSSDRLPEQPGEKILLMESIQDPGNVGTLIRTAAAFGYSGILMTDQCADPFSPKVVQASAGSVLSVWIRRTFEYIGIIDSLQGQGYALVGMTLDGEDDLGESINTEKSILALGSEASGLSRAVLQRSDYRVRIPIRSEGAESLNVAACGAICMYMNTGGSI